jgi:cytochrome c oxidase subunit 2
MFVSSIISRKFLHILIIVAFLWLVGCQAAPSTFTPKGTAAAQIGRLWWILLGTGTAVYLVVMGLMLLGLFRPGTRLPFALNGRRLIIVGGLIIPLIILIVIYGFTLTTLNALAPEKNQGLLTVEVIGHQWWWEVRYPDQQVTTANEIHIPVGQPVTLKLASDDVIHSFWVPELHGKRDLIPGRVNDFWLQADEPGEYWGLCAEFCGTQHAKMLFVVVAEPQAQFDQWLSQQQQPATAPASELSQQGLDVFIDADCDSCHTISGIDATGDFGPDLTHFASRLTLGAGAVRNTKGALAGWVVDPHGIKPGNLMPSSDVSGPELQALLAYLESLE